MSLMKILEFTAEVGAAYLKASHFRGLLDMSRPEAMAFMTHQVETLSAAQLDAYEGEFLRQALLVHDAAGRRRAMELYAYLKLQETAAYGKFRGFFS